MSTPTPGQGPWAPRPGYQRARLPQLSTTASGAPHSAAAPPQGLGPYPPMSPSGPPPWSASGTGSSGGWRRIVSTILAVLCALGLVVVLVVVSASASDMSQVALATLLALIPLGIVLLVVFWIDRWEREPWGMMLLAFLWGAGFSTVISLVVNTTTTVLVAESSYDLEGAMLVSAVVSAPIIEELTKGLGVLVVFLIWRRTFNGAVDGIVYAAVVAGGFAFAENILYFVRYYDLIVEVFILRGVFSPFTHVIFTAFTGAAIGFSARRRSRAAWLWCTPIGLVCAIVLHAFWNGVIAAAPQYYFLVGIPFFISCVGMIIWLRWAERMNMRRRLADYSRAGWFSPGEVAMLTTGAGRAQGRRWATARGPAAARAMADFQKGAAALAQLRQQAVDGHAGGDFAAEERRALESITHSRRVFLGQA
ncbi:PrsW family intramembrane metalloprotease [Actinomyces bowdenii]|uniref:PrsW family intramembrane metalloprotease n=1 Tax=Actinomyces capricornis TaxID=2755559 RepID=A0ABM7UE97_9ACTO|nr:MULTISPECIES: PrsW family intramembrane metalloprotease [Actinomyces]MCR2052230.1 PrsW family intramembrane metalloprotease [Actinomyces bowdenii]BDA65499.1 hypothetical protein MANAM107_23330 [Actinomyces capricornis]